MCDANSPNTPYERGTIHVFHTKHYLSYAWGNENKPQSIIIDNRNLSLTQSLYSLLLRL